jgi:hypothetical protein
MVYPRSVFQCEAEKPRKRLEAFAALPGVVTKADPFHLGAGSPLIGKGRNAPKGVLVAERVWRANALTAQ